MPAAPQVSGLVLPVDDSLVLDPSDDGALVVDRSSQLFPTLDECKKLLPAYARGGTSSVRDAWLLTVGAMVNALQARHSFVLDAQISPRFADGLWLDAWGVLLTRPRLAVESDADYRQRLMIAVDVVSPTAIKNAVSQALALYAPTINTNIFAWQEPIIDSAYLGPATSSDPTIPNASQQPGAVPSWVAFTQAQIVTAGVGVNQTVYGGVNRRLWMLDPTATVPKKIGAFFTPITPQIWLLLFGNAGDDSDTGFSESLSTSSVLTSSNSYAQGISGQTTLHQTNIAPSAVAYGYTQSPVSFFDKIGAEIERRRAGGVGWVVLVDLPVSQQF